MRYPITFYVKELGKNITIGTFNSRDEALKARELAKIEWTGNLSKRNTVHGLSNTREFKIWKGVRGRCNNVNNSNFSEYGGRGITVCKSWDSSFLAFYNDMGVAPTALHTIDRINNNKGYEPSNCRWATRAEQSMNRRVQDRKNLKHLGIYLTKTGSYSVSIGSNRKDIYLGTYKNKEDAIKARKNGELKYWSKNVE